MEVKAAVPQHRFSATSLPCVRAPFLVALGRPPGASAPVSYRQQQKQQQQQQQQQARPTGDRAAAAAAAASPSAPLRSSRGLLHQQGRQLFSSSLCVPKRNVASGFASSHLARCSSGCCSGRYGKESGWRQSSWRKEPFRISSSKPKGGRAEAGVAVPLFGLRRSVVVAAAAPAGAGPATGGSGRVSDEDFTWRTASKGGLSRPRDADPLHPQPPSLASTGGVVREGASEADLPSVGGQGDDVERTELFRRAQQEVQEKIQVLLEEKLEELGLKGGSEVQEIASELSWSLRTRARDASSVVQEKATEVRSTFQARATEVTVTLQEKAVELQETVVSAVAGSIQESQLATVAQAVQATAADMAGAAADMAGTTAGAVERQLPPRAQGAVRAAAGRARALVASVGAGVGAAVDRLPVSKGFLGFVAVVLVVAVRAVLAWWHQYKLDSRGSSGFRIAEREQLQNPEPLPPPAPVPPVAPVPDLRRKEPVEWVNMVLVKMFRIYQADLERWMVGMLQPMLDEMKKPAWVRRVRVTQFYLGDVAPSLRSIERRTSRRGNDLQYNVGYRYTGPMRFVLEVPVVLGALPPVTIPVGVRDFDIDAELWLRLKLIPVEPWVGTLTWAFVSRPKIKLTLAPFRIVNLMAIPFLSRYLEELLSEDLPSRFVRPNRKVVDLLKDRRRQMEKERKASQPGGQAGPSSTPQPSSAQADGSFPASEDAQGRTDPAGASSHPQTSEGASFAEGAAVAVAAALMAGADANVFGNSNSSSSSSSTTTTSSSNAKPGWGSATANDGANVLFPGSSPWDSWLDAAYDGRRAMPSDSAAASPLPPAINLSSSPKAYTTAGTISSGLVEAGAAAAAAVTGDPLQWDAIGGSFGARAGMREKYAYSGELQVTLIAAQYLPVPPRVASDPYVELQLGTQTVRSKKNSETSIIGPRGAPIWNQDFQLLVVNPTDQVLRVVVRDSWYGIVSTTLGVGEFPLKELQDTIPVDVWVSLWWGVGPIYEREKGEVKMRLTYTEFVDDEDEEDFDFEWKEDNEQQQKLASRSGKGRRGLVREPSAAVASNVRQLQSFVQDIADMAIFPELSKVLVSAKIPETTVAADLAKIGADLVKLTALAGLPDRFTMSEGLKVGELPTLADLGKSAEVAKLRQVLTSIDLLKLPELLDMLGDIQERSATDMAKLREAWQFLDASAAASSTNSAKLLGEKGSSRVESVESDGAKSGDERLAELARLATLSRLADPQKLREVVQGLELGRLTTGMRLDLSKMGDVGLVAFLLQVAGTRAYVADQLQQLEKQQGQQKQQQHQQQQQRQEQGRTALQQQRRRRWQERNAGSFTNNLAASLQEARDARDWSSRRKKQEEAAAAALAEMKKKLSLFLQTSTRQGQPGAAAGSVESMGEDTSYGASTTELSGDVEGREVGAKRRGLRRRLADWWERRRPGLLGPESAVGMLLAPSKSAAQELPTEADVGKDEKGVSALGTQEVGSEEGKAVAVERDAMQIAALLPERVYDEDVVAVNAVPDKSVKDVLPKTFADEGRRDVGTRGRG